MFKSKICKLYKDQIKEFVYDDTKDEDIYTYILIETNELISLIYLNHFYYSILGEKTIENLKQRGYISIDEVYKKYNQQKITIKEPNKRNIKRKK